MPTRAEIDGLRAIAVIPVILFHAGVPNFDGGFLGVDFFFVISGYLITSIIQRDLLLGRFSVLSFYERRARRILPALFVVCTVSALVSWLIMLPEQLIEFGWSIAAVSTFLSNYLFYSETGYFATAAELKPLLHTWSLSVEEQFYILYPALLFILFRFGWSYSGWVLGVILILSIALAETTVSTDRELAFFSLHTRGFELLAGALVATHFASLKALGFQLKNALAALGLLICLASIIFFDNTTRHPGLITIIPVAGVAMVIAFADPTNVAGRALSVFPLVGVGLISYSLYLWHQPAFAFTRLYFASNVSPLELMPPLLACFLLAYWTWRFVEQPFRRKDSISLPNLVKSTVVFLAVPACIGFAYIAGEGFPDRVGVEARRVLDEIADGQGSRAIGIRFKDCHFNEKAIDFQTFYSKLNCLPSETTAADGPILMTFGDSHSADKAWALREAGFDIGNIGGAGCPLNPEPTRADCKMLMWRIVELAKAGKIDGIVLAQRWSKKEQSHESLSSMKTFWSQSGVPILLFTPMPEFTHFREQIVKRGLRNEPLDGISFDTEMHSKSVSSIRPIFDDPQFTAIDTKDLFCGTSRIECSPFADGHSLLLDYGHLSPLGAKYLGNRIIASSTWKSWLATIERSRQQLDAVRR